MQILLGVLFVVTVLCAVVSFYQKIQTAGIFSILMSVLALAGFSSVKIGSYIDKQDGSIVETYKEYYPSVKYFNYPYKSCVNLKKCESMVNHHEASGSVNVYKKNDKSEPIYEIMWINHYFTKSWEEWCLRFLERGDIVKNHRRIADFFIINPKMLVIKNELMKKYLKYATKRIKNNCFINIT